MSIELTKKRYGVAITWDNVNNKRAVDLDIQALIVDDRGVIRDAVYYNNLMAMSGSVMHSGDETTGAAGGYDEMIWVTLPKLPPQIRIVIFIVAASGDGSLSDAEDGQIHLVEEYVGQTRKSFKVERSRADVDVVGMMEKAPISGKWSYHQVEVHAEDGDHFMDILEPTIGDLIRKVIPTAPKQQTLSFQMRKGAIVDLPMSGLQRLFFSISVSMAKGQESVDLDIAAVFMNKENKSIGCCYFDKTLLWGVTHSGENDCDEDISVDLRQVPKKVDQIFIVVNLTGAKGSVSFNKLAGAFCKVTDQNLKDIANFNLKNETADEGKGLVVCRLWRVEKRWELQALGRFCKGSTWKGCVPAIKAIIAEDREETPSSVPKNGKPNAATPTAATEELALRRRRSERRASAKKNTGLFAVKMMGEDPVVDKLPAQRGDIRRRTRPLDAKVKEMLQSQQQQEDMLSDVFSSGNGGSDAECETIANARPEQEKAQPVKQEAEDFQTAEARTLTEDQVTAREPTTVCQEYTPCRCQ
eukprot:TRINITY_DN5680_c0_g1_i1.p1 TRINITY_DN5680_c0_g1~~TRINITY_DN5680_c0_g1_i1.p1  ORF type:complete len:527 (+),score=93.45 TRINITY_DN5680_c0_g1_i1:88-1668(+)